MMDTRCEDPHDVVFVLPDPDRVGFSPEQIFLIRLSC